MTILVCQKRHHEPHYVTVPDVGFGVWGDRRCNGRAVWPHTRPKPWADVVDLPDDKDYMQAEETIAIVAIDGRWHVYWYTPPECGNWTAGCCRFLESGSFPTHAEAIQYAQKLAQERKQQHGS